MKKTSQLPRRGCQSRCCSPKWGSTAWLGARSPRPSTSITLAAQVARSFRCHGQILLSIVSRSRVNLSKPSFSTGNVGQHCFRFLVQALGQGQPP